MDLQGRLDSEVAESGIALGHTDLDCWLLVEALQELQGIPRSAKWEVSADF